MDDLLPGFQQELRDDKARVTAIKEAIEKHGSEAKTFLELGCGSGIFSRFAAGQFNSVHAIESYGDILEDLEKSFAGYGNITLQHGDARSVDLGDAQFDVILCEMLNTWLMYEQQVPALNHVLPRYLKAGGAVLPRGVVNMCDLGQFDFEKSGTIDIPEANAKDTKAMTIATVSEVANTIRFDTDKPIELDVSGSLAFKALIDCRINAVRLRSLVDWCEGISSSETKTLMLPILVPLKTPKTVKAGDAINLHFSYRHGDTPITADFSVS